MIDVGRRRLVLVAAGLLAVALVAGVAGPWLVDTGTAGDAAAFGVEEIGESAGFDYRVVQYEGVGRGGGVYVGDYDSDGWPDVLAVGGTPEAGGEGRPALYENTGGAFERSGALPDGIGRQTVAALFFDYDDDGREDLLLLRLRAEPLLLENEGGSFVRREGAFDAALTEPTGAAAADYDGDGCLDVFVVQNGDWTERTPVGHSDPGRDVTDDNGEPNYLFRGSCGEGFERVTDTGIEGTRWSLATSFVDLTGDGRPDVHVANDYNNDYVYVNEGDGTFAAVALGARTNRNGMSSEVLDVNGDGRLDLFVTNIYVDVANVSSGPIRNYLRYRLGKRADGGNNLLVNRGNGTFVDRAAAYGVRKGGWGWAAVATDFDNDGDQDLFHTTQRMGSGVDASGDQPYLRSPVYYERTGDGFQRRNGSRLGFEAANGMGAARLDYDRDGDQDLLVGQAEQGRFLLYENTAAGNGWLQVQAREPSGRPAVGVRVAVTAGDHTAVGIQTSMADFASQDARTLQFGLGSASNATVAATWPDGTTVRTEVPAGRRLHVYHNGTVVTEQPRE